MRIGRHRVFARPHTTMLTATCMPTRMRSLLLRRNAGASRWAKSLAQRTSSRYLARADATLRFAQEQHAQRGRFRPPTLPVRWATATPGRDTSFGFKAELSTRRRAAPRRERHCGRALLVSHQGGSGPAEWRYLVGVRAAAQPTTLRKRRSCWPPPLSGGTLITSLGSSSRARSRQRDERLSCLRLRQL
jgi:hypothetical protein